VFSSTWTMDMTQRRAGCEQLKRRMSGQSSCRTMKPKISGGTARMLAGVHAAPTTALQS